jgi:hypothetical protein
MAATDEQNSKAVPPESAVVVDLIGNEGRLLADDLERARVLLRDGMAKIASFVSVLQESAERAHQLANVGEQDAAAITRALSTIQVDAARAVMGLQLEDILGQLIEGTRARVGAFSQLSTALAELVARRPSLAPCVQALAPELKALTEGRANSAVSQGALEATEVELF